MLKNKIVWLASYPKAGSTWVRLFLDAYFLDSVDINDIATSFSDVRASNLTYDVVGQDIAKQLPYRNEELEHTLEAHNKIDVNIPLFIKTHSGNYLLDGYEAIPAQLTQSVIYLVRDPKDVLPSFANHTGKSIDDTLKVMRKKQMCMEDPGVLQTCLSSWDRHVTSYLDTDKFPVCVVKYEELRADPLKEFTRILKATGIEPDVKQIKRAIKLTDLSRLQSLEKSTGFKEASKHQEAGFFGKQKSKLTLQQLNKVTASFKGIIRRLDYFKLRAA